MSNDAKICIFVVIVLIAALFVDPMVDWFLR